MKITESLFEYLKEIPTPFKESIPELDDVIEWAYENKNIWVTVHPIEIEGYGKLWKACPVDTGSYSCGDGFCEYYASMNESLLIDNGIEVKDPNQIIIFDEPYYPTWITAICGGILRTLKWIV